MIFALFLSSCIGFLSLSQEILWVRYIGFACESVPQAFSFVLMAYLMGIAAGAHAGKVLCARSHRLYPITGAILIGAGVLDMLGPLLSAKAAPNPLSILLYFCLIFLCAGLKGVAFPVVHHLGALAVKGRVGKTVSRVYFANILGAALGPLITGFWLLDHASLQASMLLMGWLTAVVGVACVARGAERRLVLAGSAGGVALLALAFLQSNRVTPELAVKFGNTSLREVIENRSGIIHSLATQLGGGDFTLGGNVYDGRANIDPRVNSNSLHRVFVLAALRPEPRDVLIIGLSSGAWARIITGFPGVERIEVVEINPAYLQLIREYPDLVPILSDPRVRIHIDDGRRWLKRNPDERFDLIVMNTTYHWRSYITNLLSLEFLGLVRKHLRPGGLVSYNTTSSPDALRTAESAFKFAFRYVNFAVASDTDFRPRLAAGAEQMLRIKLDGKPVLDLRNPKDAAFLRGTLSVPFQSSADDRPHIHREPEIVTDWNMITEYKYGRKFP